MTARSIYTFAMFWALALAVAGSSLLAQEQAPAKRKTPFSYQVDIGAVSPTGQTKSSGGYKSSFMIGVGFGLPIKKWVSWDVATMDFGFGNMNQSQTIQVSNGTIASTSNYQMLFGTGARFNVPLGHGFALGLGGGAAAADQNEYVPDQISTIGGVTTITSVNCTTCAHNTFSGEYVGARLFGRSNKYSGFGVDSKYYMLKDSNSSLSSYTNLPPQRWLAIGVVFSFGI